MMRTKRNTTRQPGETTATIARRGRRIAGALALGAVGTLAVPQVGAAAGATVVDCDAGDDLQDAIDGTRGKARIEVSGTCIGTFVIGARTIEIVGHPGATLDGGGAGPVVTVAAGSTASMRDLVVTGGDSTGLSAVGGIDNRGDLALAGVTVTGNRAHSVGAFGGDFGRAIAGVDSSGTLRVVDSSVVDNHAVAEADLFGVLIGVGGVNNNEGKLDLVGSTVSDNMVEITSGPGGDVFSVGAGGVQFDGPTTMSSTTVTRNVVTTGANNGFVTGGLQGLGANPLSVDDSEVSYNTGSVTATGTMDVIGGIALFDNPLALTDSSVDHNTAISTHTAAVLVGGVLAAGSTIVEIADSSVDANVASGGEAPAIGGVLLESSEVSMTANVTDSSFDGNEAASLGRSFGGIFALGVDLTAGHIDVVQNTATGSSLAVGGLTAASSSFGPTIAVLEDSHVQLNSASAGIAIGGIFAEAASSSTVTLIDGTVSLNSPVNCSFVDPVCA